MIIAVGSQNEVKVQAVRSACDVVFGPKADITIVPCAVESDIRSQPFGDDECKQGAHTRAWRTSALCPHADYRIGIQYGICQGTGPRYYTRGWVVIQDKKIESVSATLSLPIPRAVVEYLEKNPNNNLERWLKWVFALDNINVEKGYAGLLTEGALDRAITLTPAIIAAFAPLVYSSFWDRLQEMIRE